MLKVWLRCHTLVICVYASEMRAMSQSTYKRFIVLAKWLWCEAYHIIKKELCLGETHMHAYHASKYYEILVFGRTQCSQYQFSFDWNCSLIPWTQFQAKSFVALLYVGNLRYISEMRAMSLSDCKRHISSAHRVVVAAKHTTSQLII